jgi:hypothetical protein
MPHSYQVAMAINKRLDRLEKDYRDGKDWRKKRAQEMARKKAAWEDQQAHLIQKFEKLHRGGSGGAKMQKFESSLNDIMEMADLSRALWNARRKRVAVKLRIDYTRMQLPFGWVKKTDKKTNVSCCCCCCC